VRTLMLWHRRLDRHPAHRWLRDVILSVTKSSKGLLAFTTSMS
jgi:hypothetical protein